MKDTCCGSPQLLLEFTSGILLMMGAPGQAWPSLLLSSQARGKKDMAQVHRLLSGKQPAGSSDTTPSSLFPDLCTGQLSVDLLSSSLAAIRIK